MKVRLLIVATCLLLTVKTMSQTAAPDPSPVVVTTYSVEVGGDDPGFRIDSMVMYYVDKGIRPNTMIKNFRILRHWWGADNSKVIFIYEIDKFENIDKAATKTGDLIDASFKTEEEKKTFWKHWGKVFNRHEDSIMTDFGKPKM